MKTIDRKSLEVFFFFLMKHSINKNTILCQKTKCWETRHWNYLYECVPALKQKSTCFLKMFYLRLFLVAMFGIIIVRIWCHITENFSDLVIDAIHKRWSLIFFLPLILGKTVMHKNIAIVQKYLKFVLHPVLALIILRSIKNNKHYDFWCCFQLFNP